MNFNGRTLLRIASALLCVVGAQSIVANDKDLVIPFRTELLRVDPSDDNQSFYTQTRKKWKNLVGTLATYVEKEDIAKLICTYAYGYGAEKNDDPNYILIPTFLRHNPESTFSMMRILGKAWEYVSITKIWMDHSISSSFLSWRRESEPFYSFVTQRSKKNRYQVQDLLDESVYLGELIKLLRYKTSKIKKESEAYHLGLLRDRLDIAVDRDLGLDGLGNLLYLAYEGVRENRRQVGDINTFLQSADNFLEAHSRFQLEDNFLRAYESSALPHLLFQVAGSSNYTILLTD